MRLEARKRLYDVRSAVELLTEFTAGKTFRDYERDAMLRLQAKLPVLRREVDALLQES